MKKNKNPIRTLRRTEAKEAVDAHKFWKVTMTQFKKEFYFTDGEQESYDVFEKYNGIWKRHCGKINSKYKIFKADPKAFLAYFVSEEFKVKNEEADTKEHNS